MISLPLAKIYFKTLLSTSKNNKKGKAFSIALPLIGVTAGVAGFLMVISVMNGFVKELKERLLKFEPHLILECDENRLDLAKINQDKDVKTAFFFDKKDAFALANQKAFSVNVVAFSDQSMKDLGLSDSFFLGKPLNDAPLKKDASAVIIAPGLKKQLSLSFGDEFTLFPLERDPQNLNLDFFQYPVYAYDVFRARNHEMDQKWILTSFEVFSELFFTPKDQLNRRIWIQLFDPFENKNVARRLSKMFDLKKENIFFWQDRNQTLLKALKLERWAVLFVLNLVVLVSCFSIAITLILFIKKRTKEMAILMTLGLPRRQLKNLYLLIGLTIGLSGVVLGTVISLICLYWMKEAWGFDLMNRFLLFLGLSSLPNLPVAFSLFDFVFCSVLTVILSGFASYWPTRLVNSVNVTDVLSKRVL
jgi:ABC-type lipoprotein release transport system permease subunit